MNRRNEAIKLFEQKYGETPSETGLSVISIYEEQHAFLYATSEEVIKAYKNQQNIIRWMIKWYIWPLVLVFLIWLVALLKFQDALHPLCVFAYTFYGIWAVLCIVLGIKVWKAKRIAQLGETITFVNY